MTARNKWREEEQQRQNELFRKMNIVRAMEAGYKLDLLVARHALRVADLALDDHQGDHSWLDDPANYPHVTYQSSPASERLLFWSGVEGDGVRWAPSVDIEAAMGAVGRLIERWGGNLRVDLTVSGTGASCSLVALTGHGRQGYAEAETLPLAICRALLLEALGRDQFIEIETP